MAHQSGFSRRPPPAGLQNQSNTGGFVTKPAIRMGRTNYSPAEDRFIAYHRLHTLLTWNMLAEEFGWRWKARTQGSLQARWNEIKNNKRFFLPKGYVVPDIDYPVALANELVYFSKGPYYG